MNKLNIFVDTNVLIGAFVGIQKDETALKYLFSLKGVSLYVSALSVAQLTSSFQQKRKGVQQKTKIEIINIIKRIRSKFEIISFEEGDIEKAICQVSDDIEDNMQYCMGVKLDCFYFVTNNKKDYTPFNDIVAIIPERVRIINP